MLDIKKFKQSVASFEGPLAYNLIHDRFSYAEVFDNNLANERKNLNSYISKIEKCKKVRPLIDSINESELLEYLLKTINDCVKNKDQFAQDYHDEQMKYINNEFLNSERNEQTNLFNKKVSERKRGDNSIYRQAISNVNSSVVNTKRNINELIAKESLKLIMEPQTYCFQIVKNIANFESETKESIIIETLFEKFNQKKSGDDTFEINYLKDLFFDIDKWNEIKESLLKGKFMFDNKDETFNWIGDPNDSSLKPKKSLITLAVVLELRNYLKPNQKVTKIAKALNNTFKGFDVSNKYYGDVKKSIIERGLFSVADSYYTSYNIIPENNS